MTEPTVATKGSNSDSLGNRSSGFQLPESPCCRTNPFVWLNKTVRSL
ncbi:MAG: hypothetical protein WBI06_06030 [Paludibacter sp.]